VEATAGRREAGPEDPQLGVRQIFCLTAGLQVVKYFTIPPLTAVEQKFKEKAG
jgi:hypothetical protein